jgi:hypothetical protein
VSCANRYHAALSLPEFVDHYLRTHTFAERHTVTPTGNVGWLPGGRRWGKDVLCIPSGLRTEAQLQGILYAVAAKHPRYAGQSLAEFPLPGEQGSRRVNAKLWTEVSSWLRSQPELRKIAIQTKLGADGSLETFFEAFGFTP